MDIREEFEYYLANQGDFVSKYDGKHIVLEDHEVIGVFNTHSEAFFWIKSNGKLGKCLIQEVSPGPEAYTITFHSRVFALSA